MNEEEKATMLEILEKLNKATDGFEEAWALQHKINDKHIDRIMALEKKVKS